LLADPGRTPRDVLDAMLNGGLTLRIMADTPLGQVEQDVVIRATLGPGGFRHTAPGLPHAAPVEGALFGADLNPDIVPNALNAVPGVHVPVELQAHFTHDLRITMDAPLGEFHRTAVIEGAVDSSIAVGQALQEQAPQTEPIRENRQPLRREQMRKGHIGFSENAVVDATPAPAVELHRTITRLLHPSDPPRRGTTRPAPTAQATQQILDATSPIELWGDVRQTMSEQGRTITLDSGPLSEVTIKLDLRDRQLLEQVETEDGPRYRVRATPAWDVKASYRKTSANDTWSGSLLSAPDAPVDLWVDEQGLADLGLAPTNAPATHALETITEEDEDTPGVESTFQPNPRGPSAEVLQGMPDYLVDSEGFGEAAPHTQVKGISVERAFRGMLPAGRRILVKRQEGGPRRPVGRHQQQIKGLHHVERAMKNDVPSMLGDGREFTVEIDGKPHTLVVKAKLDWTTAQGVPGKPRWTMPPETRYRRFRRAGGGYSVDPSLALPITVTASPPLLVIATPSGTPNVNQQMQRDVSEEHKRASLLLDLDVRASEVHVSYEFELRDAKQDLVGRVGHGEDEGLGGTLRFGHPKAPRANGGRGLKPLTGSPPKDFGLEELLVNTPEGSSFFDQVAQMLPKHLTEVGAPGRDVLQEFLHRTNIKAELMSMVTADPIDHPDSSWRRSDPLIKGPVSSPLDLFRHGSAIEMRAVARQVEIIEEIEDTDDKKHTSALLDWDNSKAARTDTWTAKRRGALSVFAGTFVTAGKFIVTLGGLVSLSHDRSWSSKFKRETGIRFEHDFGGKLVRYKTVYQLQVRVLGQPPVFLEGDLVGTQVATRERALASGIVDPAGPDEHAPRYRTGDDRTHFAPQHLESGLSTAGAKVHSFRGKDRIYAAIADTLRKVPNHRWYHFSSSEFIKYFDDPDLAAGLKSLVNDTTRRQRNAKSRMSDKQLMQLVDLMLGPGLVVPLVKQGPFTDTVVMVRIKATLEGLADGDLQIDLADSTTETRTKEYETRTFTATRSTSAGIGVQGRVTAAIVKGANVFLATLKVGRTWSSAVSLANDTGKVTEHKHAGTKLTESGGQNETPMRHFAGDLRLTPEVTTYTRTNKMLRRISLGKPGRHGLDVRPVPLDGEFTGLTGDQATPLGQTVPVELLVPDHLVTEGAEPARIEVTQSPREDLPAGTVIDSLPKGDRTVEGADVLTVVGTEHIVDSVYRMLERSSSNDPAFAQRTGNNDELITDQFSPEAFRKDPRIFGKVHVVEGLGHERRRADVHARAGVVLKPVNPRRLGPEEYQRTKNTTVSGTAVSMAKGATTSVDFDITNVDAIGGTAAPVAGGATGAPEGVFIFRFAPWAARFGRKRAQRIQGVEKNHFTPNPTKRVLISVGVEASVVAETQVRGNLDFAELTSRPPLGSAGEKFTLTDSVLMWVTEEQLAELERQDQERVDSAVEATPEDETLPAPESMRNPNVTSLGIGGVADRIDISEVIDDLRQAITDHAELGPEAAEQLLPRSPLTSSHNNTRVVNELLSNVDRMFTTVMNGGVGTPLRVEFRFSGRTYVFTVEGEWAVLPAEGEIEIVRKLAARNIVSLGDTDEKMFGQNIIDVTG
ncbi:MAG TPA: hypothetical protein VF821_05590, partial [Lentzea sp.]